MLLVRVRFRSIVFRSPSFWNQIDFRYRFSELTHTLCNRQTPDNIDAYADRLSDRTSSLHNQVHPEHTHTHTPSSANMIMRRGAVHTNTIMNGPPPLTKRHTRAHTVKHSRIIIACARTRTQHTHALCAQTHFHRMPHKHACHSSKPPPPPPPTTPSPTP